MLDISFDVMFFDKVEQLQRKTIKSRRDCFDLVQKVIVKDRSRDCRSDSGSRGDQGFGDSGRDRLDGRTLRYAESLKSDDNADDRSEKTDERRRVGSRGKPAQASLHLSDFGNGCGLQHAVQRFEASHAAPLVAYLAGYLIVASPEHAGKRVLIFRTGIRIKVCQFRAISKSRQEFFDGSLSAAQPQPFRDDD